MEARSLSRQGGIRDDRKKNIEERSLVPHFAPACPCLPTGRGRQGTPPEAVATIRDGQTTMCQKHQTLNTGEATRKVHELTSKRVHERLKKDYRLETTDQRLKKVTKTQGHKSQKRLRTDDERQRRRTVLFPSEFRSGKIPSGCSRKRILLLVNA